MFSPYLVAQNIWKGKGTYFPIPTVSNHHNRTCLQKWHPTSFEQDRKQNSDVCTAAEHLKLHKYREKTVQERMEGLAHSIRKSSGFSCPLCYWLPCMPAPTFCSFLSSSQHININSQCTGNYFTAEGRRRNVAFTGTLKVTKLQLPSYPQCFPGAAMQPEMAMQGRREGPCHLFQYIG